MIDHFISSLFANFEMSIVSQLSKCLKSKSIWGDKNDCILYKITPRNLTNFGHLLSCDTIGAVEAEI